MEQLVGSGDLALFVHLRHGDDEPQRWQHREEVPQLACVPVRDLHRVDRDRDASALPQHRGDLIGVAPPDDEEIRSSHSEPCEALAQRRARSFLDRDVHHRAGRPVEDARSQRALARPRRAREHHEGLASDHDAGAPGELLNVVGLAHQVGGGGDLQGAVYLGAGASTELVDAARLPAASTERRSIIVGIAALEASPNHWNPYSLTLPTGPLIGGREV